MEIESETSSVNNTTAAMFNVAPDDRIDSGDVITRIRDTRHTLGKTYTRETKQSAVAVAFGIAVQVHVPDQAALERVLREVADDPHAAIIPGGFPGIPIGEDFLIYSMAKMAEHLKCSKDDRKRLAGVHPFEYQGKPIKAVCRMKENITPSRWVLLDRDVDEQTPEQFGTGMNFDAWLEGVEKLLPGLSQVPQVHVASSSARVLRDGKPYGEGNSHVWAQVRDPRDIERLRAALLVKAAERDMTWLKVNKHGTHGRLTTIVDVSVFTTGRLVFCGKPSVSGDLVVVDQVITRAGGDVPLDTSVVELPEDKVVREVTRRAGCELTIKKGRDGGLVMYTHDLTLDTEIVLEGGEVCTVQEASKRLDPNNPKSKLRCQTPYRESDSWAGFLCLNKDGQPYLHDSGDTTTHWLCNEDYTLLSFEDIGEQERTEQERAREEVEGLVAASEVLGDPEYLAKELQRPLEAAGYTPMELAALVESLPDTIPDEVRRIFDAVPVESATEQVDFIPLPGGTIILPSDHFPYSKAAERIFTLLAKTKTMFLYGGAVTELKSTEHGPELKPVGPAELQSRIDRHGKKVMSHISVNGNVVLKNKRCPRQTAEVLLASLEARETLPPIGLIAAAPLLIEHDGRVLTLQPGYHPECGGILVLKGAPAPEDVPLAAAVRDLAALLSDFDFQTPSDMSRALAMLVTPALKMGGLLTAPMPIDVAEADQSQAGKTLRQNLTRLIYRERGYAVTRRDGGVGSLDESIGAALLSGRAFITMDNLRGRLDSQFLEAVITFNGPVGVRVPHRGEVAVDPRQRSFSLTSNGVETTRDLANRSCIVRIRKRPNGYSWRQWIEGGIEAHTTARQSHYLGCVHAVVRQWIAQGKPVTTERRHDMWQWAGALDWIVREIFGAAPLMDGHEGAQERVSNPALVWLRAVCLAVAHGGRLGDELSASMLWELCRDEGIDMPSARSTADDVAGQRYVGQIMAKIYRNAESNAVEVDDYSVQRIEREERSEERRRDVLVRRYVFLRPAPHCALGELFL